MAGSALFLVACNDDDDKIEHFSALVDISASSLAVDDEDDYNKYHTITVFSTDGGANFVQYPKLAPGQTYMVKAVLDDLDITGDNCFDVDWSASNPKPTSVSGGVATFVMGTTSDISGVVTNIPVVASELAGTYTVVTDDWEDYHAGDQLTVEAIDATHIQIVEYPATAEDHSPLVITITNLTFGTALVEDQYSGSYGGATYEMNTSGAGSINPCAGVIDLVLDFNLPNYPMTSEGNHLTITKN